MKRAALDAIARIQAGVDREDAGRLSLAIDEDAGAVAIAPAGDLSPVD